jgi:hypothetical protein
MVRFFSRAGHPGWLAVLCLSYGGCSSASDGNRPSDLEQTGEISAAIERVPDDTRCVTLSLSVYSRFYDSRYVQQDVTPGESASIRIGSLAPGYGSVSGQAYSTACSQIYPSYDGGPGGQQTWNADTTYFYVQTGRNIQVQLNFRRLGGVDIGINFDECSCDQFGVCTIVDDAGTAVTCQPSGDGGVPIGQPDAAFFD